MLMHCLHHSTVPQTQRCPLLLAAPPPVTLRVCCGVLRANSPAPGPAAPLAVRTLAFTLAFTPAFTLAFTPAFRSDSTLPRSSSPPSLPLLTALLSTTPLLSRAVCSSS